MRSPQHFEITWESRFGAWAEDFFVLFSRVPVNPGGIWPLRSMGNDGPLKPVLGFLFSVCLHVTALVLITQLNFSAGYEPPHETQASDPAPIYLDLEALKELKILRALPVVKPAGPGGQPGTSENPVRVVLRASTVQHPKYTVVLHPLKADNKRQAINQSGSPPDLKIPVEQKIPDIVLAEEPAPAKPRVDMSLRQPLAPQTGQNHPADPAPTIALNEAALQLKIVPTVQQPKLPITALQQPLVPGSVQDRPAQQAPMIASNNPVVPFQMPSTGQQPKLPIAALEHPTVPAGAIGRSSDAAPAIPSNDPALPFKMAQTVRQPKLPVTALHQPLVPHGSQSYPSGSAPAPPVAVGSKTGELQLQIASGGGQQPQVPASYFGSNSLQSPHAAGASAGNAGTTSAGASGDSTGGGVVVISVDPGTFSKLSSLAQGNRYGMLAIAPSQPGIGSPGGNSMAGTGGSGGPGNGGDERSSGVGPGHSGGGGGGPEQPARATFSAVGGSGRAGGVDSNKLLGAVRPTTIYAVTSPTKLRRAPLVVSTGPIGGGGLDAYGALHCGKVYTIFLPMPGKSWVLQYCAHQGQGQEIAEDPEPAKTSVVQMEVGLVPPAADQEFDFHRLAVPEKDADKMILLRGLIDRDGAVSDVQVYQGVLAEMDAQAALAFSNWKFRPASRANRPISVDVLVGIPAKLPEKLGEAPSGALGSQNR